MESADQKQIAKLEAEILRLEAEILRLEDASRLMIERAEFLAWQEGRIYEVFQRSPKAAARVVGA